MKTLVSSIALILFVSICLAQTGGTPTSGTSGSASCISSFPYNNDFEISMGWFQSSGDDFDWSRLSGTTPSSGSTSGGSTSGHSAVITSNDSFPPPPPAGGTSTGGSNTSTVTPNDSTPPNPKTAILTSPCFDLTNYSKAKFSFSYWIDGAANTLTLEKSTDGVYWTTVWSQTGGSSNAMNDSTFDLLPGKDSSSLQLRFKGTLGLNRSGNSLQGEMGIDNLVLTPVGASGRAKRTSLDASPSSQMKTFPNPFQNQFSVTIPFVENQTATLLLSDIKGRQVFFQSGIQTGESITIQPQVAPGIYILTVQAGNERYQSKLLRTE